MDITIGTLVACREAAGPGGDGVTCGGPPIALCTTAFRRALSCPAGTPTTSERSPGAPAPKPSPTTYTHHTNLVLRPPIEFGQYTHHRRRPVRHHGLGRLVQQPSPTPPAQQHPPTNATPPTTRSNLRVQPATSQPRNGYQTTRRLIELGGSGCGYGQSRRIWGWDVEGVCGGRC